MRSARRPHAASPTFQIDAVGALKDAALAALVALGLFGLMIGIRTDQGPTGALVITTRLSVCRDCRCGLRRPLVLALGLGRTHAPTRRLASGPAVRA